MKRVPRWEWWNNPNDTWMPEVDLTPSMEIFLQNFSDISKVKNLLTLYQDRRSFDKLHTEIQKYDGDITVLVHPYWRNANDYRTYIESIEEHLYFSEEPIIIFEDVICPNPSGSGLQARENLKHIRSIVPLEKEIYVIPTQLDNPVPYTFNNFTYYEDSSAAAWDLLANEFINLGIRRVNLMGRDLRIGDISNPKLNKHLPSLRNELWLNYAQENVPGLPQQHILDGCVGGVILNLLPRGIDFSLTPVTIPDHI